MWQEWGRCADMKEQELLYNTRVVRRWWDIVAGAYSTRKTWQVVEEGNGAYMKELAGLYSIHDDPYCTGTNASHIQWVSWDQPDQLSDNERYLMI